MATISLFMVVKLELRALYPYLHAIFWVFFNGYDISLILVVYSSQNTYSLVPFTDKKIEAQKF